jgi:hypothetical protein
VIGFFDRLWHQYVQGHSLVFHEALRPDSQISDGYGKLLINVYNQDTFQRPDAHYECNCGKTWAIR